MINRLLNFDMMFLCIVQLMMIFSSNFILRVVKNIHEFQSNWKGKPHWSCSQK